MVNLFIINLFFYQTNSYVSNFLSEQIGAQTIKVFSKAAIQAMKP